MRPSLFAAGVKGIAFPANGDCLLAAMQDGLQVLGYEPVRRLDTVDIPWAKAWSEHNAETAYDLGFLYLLLAFVEFSIPQHDQC